MAALSSNSAANTPRASGVHTIASTLTRSLISETCDIAMMKGLIITIEPIIANVAQPSDSTDIATASERQKANRM